MLSKTRISVVFAVIGAIGLITLPEDTETWGDRISDLWSMIEGNPVSALAILVGILVLLVANWETLSRRFLGSKRWKTDKELGDDLHSWLRELRWQLRDVGNEDFIDPQGVHLSFGFIATDSGKRPVQVLKVQGETSVRLQGSVIPSAEPEKGQDKSHKQIIEGMSDSERDAMLEEAGLELVRLGVDFNAEDYRRGGSRIWMTSGFVPNDSLTLAQFMGHVSLIEPPREKWRLQAVRGWSNDKIGEVSNGDSGTGGTPCGGAPGRVPVTVGGDQLDRHEVRNDTGDAAEVGAAG